jgi:hypothetical protein
MSTGAQIITFARNLIAESSPSASYSSDADFLAFINDGINDACTRGKVYEKSAVVTATSGTASYALAADFLSMRTIYFGGVALDPIEPTALGRLYIPIAGKPTYYFITQTSGAYYVTLVDTPTTTGAGTGAYTCIYFALSAALTTTADTPSFPADKHRCLVYFAISRHFAKMKDVGKAQSAMQEYAAILGLQPQGGQPQ